MSKILIKGNKVIIDGHTSDLETCNTLTNLCDELSTSKKFRTVKYESGYGEFESVSENEEKKFDIVVPPPPELGYQVNIQSNDGSTILAQNATINSVVVTSAGAQLKYEDTVKATYTYSGSKLFAGLATSANALVAEYKPGDTVPITAETTLYIVENIIIPEHHSSLNELFTNIAAVIREKTGDTASIVAADFPSVIRERLQQVKPFKPDGESYLTFSSPNSFTLKVNDTTKHWDGTLEYFSSDEIWSTWDGTTTLSSATTGSKNVLYLRGTGNTVITGNNLNYKWVLTGSDISCIGNIENLLDYATVKSGNHPTMADYCYSGMFQGCTSLVNAPSLPAATLTNYCYQSMFYGCTSLTQAPSELPATTLADYCYNQMFMNCTSLTKAPALPATTLTNYCYRSMFRGCSSLTQAPDLPATTLTSNCYNGMFMNCASLTQTPALPATTLATYCYSNMFQGCTSLTQALALPATTLAERCYYSMFYGCTSLVNAPSLPATTLTNYCYQSMFYGCTSLVNAPSLPATTLTERCYNQMFRGCTSLTQIPSLPATTLTTYCYYGMFWSCSKIKLSKTQTGEYTVAYRIPTTGTGTTASNALNNMFISTGGTFKGTPSINTTYYLSNTNTVVR